MAEQDRPHDWFPGLSAGHRQELRDVFGGPIDPAMEERLKAEVEDAIRSLTTEELRVFRLRNGLVDGCVRTQVRVGQEMGISRRRVSRLERLALDKLRHPSAQNP